MYLVIEQVSIENPLKEIAFFIEKLKNVIQNGMTIPPPPTPAIVLSAITAGRTIRPANSGGNIGNMALW